MTALRRGLAAVAGLVASLLAVPAYAGGPLVVNGAGQPLAWTLDPVPFNPDRGSLGTLGNATAVGHLASDAAVRNAVPTATVVMQNAGTAAGRRRQGPRYFDAAGIQRNDGEQLKAKDH